MTASNVKLLPLPEPDLGLLGQIAFIRSDESLLKWCHANVEHHIAAKDAEIEALRADLAAQRARADAMAGEAIKHEARAEQLTETLRGARDRMLGQVKWVACDCGCERDKPADAASVTWLRASDLLRDQEEGK